MEEKQENLLQNTMQEKAKYYGNRIWRDMSSLGKWLILAVVTGCIVGAASSLFSYVLKTVTNVREEHLWIFYLLPVSGLIIVFLYQKFGKDDGGPNQVFMTIRSKDDVPLKSAPLINCPYTSDWRISRTRRCSDPAWRQYRKSAWTYAATG